MVCQIEKKRPPAEHAPTLGPTIHGGLRDTKENAKLTQSLFPKETDPQASKILVEGLRFEGLRLHWNTMWSSRIQPSTRYA